MQVLWIGGVPYRLEAFRSRDAVRASEARRMLRGLRGELALVPLRSVLSQLGLDPSRVSDTELLRQIDGRLSSERLFLTPIREARRPDDLLPPPLGRRVEEPLAPEGPPAEVRTDDPVLVQVQWLDGDDATLVQGGPYQWVNLPKEAKWLHEDHIGNLDRLTQRPRLFVRFNKPGSHPFKLRMLPGGANVEYKGPEEGRNANFKYEKSEKSYTTEGDGTKIIDGDMFVTCAGKDTFAVEGEDNKGNKRRSTYLTNRRFIYVQEIKMNDEAGAGPIPTIAASLGGLKGEMGGHGIHIEQMEPESIDFMENISDAEKPAFISAVQSAYSASAKEPYVLAIAYTGHLAVMTGNKRVMKTGVRVGPAASPVEIAITNDKHHRKPLWNEIVTGEDWFVSATFRQRHHSRIPIPREKITLVPEEGVPQKSARVRIDVSDLPAAKGTIRLNVNWVEKMRGGISFGATNIVCVCTRAYWEEVEESRQNEILIHEIGHKIGMVSDGTGNKPDKPPFHYTEHGHKGNHCHKGLKLKKEFEPDDEGQCVMFGQSSHSSFCSDCSPVVRKLDISEGWHS